LDYYCARTKKKHTGNRNQTLPARDISRGHQANVRWYRNDEVNFL
jgi:hypothetical protein